MIWLVGSKGMLGREVGALLDARGRAFTPTDSDLDISDEAGVARAATSIAPRWIVNCAAYTAVDRAEAEEARAHAVNALGPRNLARAARTLGTRLIHVSTDYVFSGKREGPYPEDAPTDPLSAYGRSKAAGEVEVRETLEQHMIVRTSWLHGPHGASFVGTILRLLAERPELRVVDDQHGSPTYAADLAAALVGFIEQDVAEFGTFHFTNEGSCTWHGFASEIQRQALALGLIQKTVPIHPIPTSAYTTPASRPANSRLTTDRIRAVLPLTIPPWQDGLARHLERRRLGSPHHG